MPIDSLAETAEETAQFEAMMNEQPAPEPEKQPEPAPQPEAKPEPQPEAKAATPEPKAEPEKPVRLVPHQALHEEREKRKALEHRIAELEKTQQRPQPSGDEPPDETTDPIGSIAWLKAKLASKEKDEQEANAQREYLQDLGQKVQVRIDAYAAEHPEYTEQVQFLREFRFRELTEGLGYNQRFAAAQVQQEEIALGKMAIDNDLDPGAMVAKLASVRGWKAKEAAPSKPAPDAAKDAEAKIERLERGQKAATSSSGSGGGAPDDEMTLERLLALKGKAFDDAFEKHGKRLMGG